MSVAKQTSRVCVKCHQMENSNYHVRQQKMFHLEREANLESFTLTKPFLYLLPLYFTRLNTNLAFKTKVLIDAMENS